MPMAIAQLSLLLEQGVCSHAALSCSMTAYWVLHNIAIKDAFADALNEYE
jgi:tRNA C32,U32 (ribose-2'-O)-methylase TrmJ